VVAGIGICEAFERSASPWEPSGAQLVVAALSGIGVESLCA
jgi:hypothetical protein